MDRGAYGWTDDLVDACIAREGGAMLLTLDREQAACERLGLRDAAQCGVMPLDGPLFAAVPRVLHFR